MKVLVTGGAGFIGSHLVDALIRKKHRVIVVDDLSAGYKRYINPSARFIKCSIGSRTAEATIKKYNPSTVFHLAAQKNLRMSLENPRVDARINVVDTLNILEACRLRGVKKVIFSSTGGAIYGDTKLIPTTEVHREDPVSPYGISKLAIDKYLYYYSQVHGLKSVSLRLSNVYGPRQDPKGEAGVVAIFLQNLISGRQPLINGSGKQTRDYIYVADIIEAFMKSMQNKEIKGIYNVGTGVETSVNKLYADILKCTGFDVPPKHTFPLPGEQQRSCLSYDKMRRVTGWKPQKTLNKGLLETYNWFNNNNGK